MIMAGSSIIERIAAERKRKKMQRLKAKRKKKSKKDLSLTDLERMKAELDGKIKSAKDKPDSSDRSSDERLLDAIKKEIQSKRSTSEPEEKKQVQLRELSELVKNGTQEQWTLFIAKNLKSKTKMEFPPLDPEKSKFDDYGYRQLIELIINSENLLRIITEVKDVSEFNLVELNNLIRGDEATLRGIEALCSLLINRENRYDPVCETDFKYLDIILNSITTQKKEGKNRVWNIKTNAKEITITAGFNKDERVWVYSVSSIDSEA
jgi:hypothetical protein